MDLFTTADDKEEGVAFCVRSTVDKLFDCELIRTVLTQMKYIFDDSILLTFVYD